MKRISISLALAVAACGGTTTPANSPATTTTTGATTSVKAAEPESKLEPEPAPATETASPTPAPLLPVDAPPEKCNGGWVCVKVSLDKRKVEQRETKLLGDPKIEQTWSKMSDGRTVTFDAFSKGAVELTLRRKPNDKNEVVIKTAKGGEIVIDRHDGSIDDFTHVGAIAAEQDGALLIDLRYMK